MYVQMEVYKDFHGKNRENCIYLEMKLLDEALVLGYQLMYRCGIIKTVNDEEA